MSKKRSSFFLFAVLSATVVLFISTAAVAKVCIFRIGGTCIFWSGSVRAELNADKPGNIQNKSKAISFTINRIEGAGMPGLVYCKSRNPNITTVEIKPALFGGIFSATEDITQGHIKPAQTVTGAQTAAVVPTVAKLSNSQLRDLDQQCGDPNWGAIDFVPSEFETQVSLVNKNRGKVDSWVIIRCTLPNPSTLGWDSVNNRPEQREYQCVRIKDK
jgi:hypothetical protein